jgi:hypothetical protein
LVLALSLATAALTLAWPQLAAAAASTAPEAAVQPAEADLPALPKPRSLELVPPDKADVDELDARITRLLSDNPEDRKDAVREVFEVPTKLVAAILQRLDKLAARADREGMKRVLAQIREKSSRAAAANEPSVDDANDSHADLLVQLIEKAHPKNTAWRELTELIALSRMLTQIGNIDAARGLVEIYARFGEFVRVDVQNRLFDLRDGAIAALIETRRHRAEKLAQWADRQLDRLGKGVPSEAIRTDNFEVLADILRAYGRTKDPDAARIIVSYASSERFQLREAARQAIVMLGDVGLWQLREAYETVVGKRPRRDWSWDRTARELFFEYDKLHTSKLRELIEQGKKAEREGHFEDMAKAYDAVLARAPEFDAAPTLAPGYLGMAEKLAQSRPEVAQTALVRVLRLTTDPAMRQRAQSLRDTIRAEQQLHEGIVDAHLLHQAAELDPNNRRAKELLSAGDRAVLQAETIRTRWLTSGAIALMATVAILFVLLRRRSPAPAPLPAPHDENARAQETPDGGTPGRSTTAPADQAQPPHTANPTPNAMASDESANGDAEPPPKRRDPFEDL